jgi:cell division protein FtsB
MKRRRLFAAVAGAAFVVMVIVVFTGDQGILTFYHSFRQVKKLRMELDNSHHVIDSLKIEIDRLKNDTVYIEQIAREKYGMTGKNEKMYKFIEEK